MTGLAIATPKQPQNTQNVSVIQKLKEQYKAFKNKVNDFKNNEEAMESLAVGSQALVITTYLFERSIALGHEMSHCAASWLTLQPSYFYVSPKFGGGSYAIYYSTRLTSDPLARIFDTIITIAGPIGGTITCLAWLKMCNIFTQHEKSKSFKEHCIKGWKKPLFNENSSHFATAIVFMSAYQQYYKNMFPKTITLNHTYGSHSGIIIKNDGLQILENLQELSPTLAKMYLPLVSAGLVGLVGYQAYALYKIFKAKYKAHQENKSFVWY